MSADDIIFSPIPTFEDWVQEMMRIKKSKIPDHYNRLMKYLFFVGGLRLATDVIAEALDRMKKSGDYVPLPLNVCRGHTYKRVVLKTRNLGSAGGVV